MPYRRAPIWLLGILLAGCSPVPTSPAATPPPTIEPTPIPRTIPPAITATLTPQAAQLRICIDGVDGQPIDAQQREAISEAFQSEIQSSPDSPTRFGGGTLQMLDTCPTSPTIRSPQWAGPAVGSGAPHLVQLKADESMDAWKQARPAHLYIFVGAEGLLEQSFGTSFPRRTPQEMACQGSECAELISAVYLTPADIASGERLRASLRALAGL